MKIDIALFQPEIAGNVGTIIRNCACFGADLHIIEPCGFPFDINKVKKSALDYYHKIKIYRHNSYDDFILENVERNKKRIILATTKGGINLKDFKFANNDIILFGQESCGVPDYIHQQLIDRIYIKMQDDCRSLNIAVSCGIFLAFAQS